MKLRSRIARASLTPLLCLCLIAAVPIDTSALRNAKAAYDQSEKAANKVFSDAMTSAGETYLKSLNTALNAALEAKDLDQANSINAEIKSFKAKSLNPTPFGAMS